MPLDDSSVFLYHATRGMLDLDTRLLLLLNGQGDHWTDVFWTAFTSLVVWIPLAAVTLYDVWRACKGSAWRKILFLLIIVTLIAVLDQTSSSLLKPFVARIRPSHDPAVENMLHFVNGYRGGQYGFVSGHATNIGGICTWLFLIFRHWLGRICFIFFALALGYSRIYLGVHYPGDVLCGFLLGVTVAWIGYRVVRHYFSVDSARCPRAIVITFSATVLTLALYALLPPQIEQYISML